MRAGGHAGEIERGGCEGQHCVYECASVWACSWWVDFPKILSIEFLVVVVVVVVGVN